MNVAIHTTDDGRIVATVGAQTISVWAAEADLLCTLLRIAAEQVRQ